MKREQSASDDYLESLVLVNSSVHTRIFLSWIHSHICKINQRSNWKKKSTIRIEKTTIFANMYEYSLVLRFFNCKARCLHFSAVSYKNCSVILLDRTYYSSNHYVKIILQNWLGVNLQVMFGVLTFRGESGLSGNGPGIRN